jgi:hypothetical protein
MKKLVVTLVALALATPAAAIAPEVAPAVKRKPAPTAPPAARQAAPAPVEPVASEPVAPASTVSPAQQVAPAPMAALPAPRAARTMSERDSYAALAAVGGQGSDAALDTSLIRVMSRLVAAGRCGEAAGLASRGGRKELASRAQQLCK